MARVYEVKNKFATIDPTVNDDSTKNYSIGSLWVNSTSRQIFVLMDNAAAAAVWDRIDKPKSNSTTTDPTVTNDSSQGYEFGSLWYNTATKKLFMLSDSSVGVAVWNTSTSVSAGTKILETFEDFQTGGATGFSYGGGLTVTLTGAGTSAAAISSAGTGAIGIVSLGSGTSATGRSSVLTSATGLVTGTGELKYSNRSRLPILSVAAQTYTIRMGFLSGVAALDPTDGIYFRYTHGTNAGRWQAVTRNNSTETATDTGVTAVANTWTKFNITINATGTSALFDIGGTQVTITTNIPTAARAFGVGAAMIKTVGITSCGLELDYLTWSNVFTTDR